MKIKLQSTHFKSEFSTWIPWWSIFGRTPPPVTSCFECFIDLCTDSLCNVGKDCPQCSQKITLSLFWVFLMTLWAFFSCQVNARRSRNLSVQCSHLKLQVCDSVPENQKLKNKSETVCYFGKWLQKTSFLYPCV